MGDVHNVANSNFVLGAPDGRGGGWRLGPDATALLSGFGEGEITIVDSLALAAMLGVSEATLFQADFISIEHNGVTGDPMETGEWTFDDGTSSVTLVHDFNAPAGAYPVLSVDQISNGSYSSFFMFSPPWSGGDNQGVLIDFDGFGLDLESPDLTVRLDAEGAAGSGSTSPDPDMMGFISLADADDDGSVPPDDCAVLDPDVFPGAPELCDGLDNDCDGFLPADEVDSDGDGVLECQGDCDDLDCTVHPAAPELLDLLDNDCDGLVDEGLDSDGDGVPDLYDVEATGDVGQVGVDPLGQAVCAVDPDDDGDGYPASADCDDGNDAINPGAVESCNGIDDDCDSGIDEGFDIDGDGFTVCANDCDDTDLAVNPDAIELPGNAIDEDCDGTLGTCDPGADWKNHGEYVRCVNSECEALVDSGALTEEQCDQLVNQAAKSGIGTK